MTLRILLVKSFVRWKVKDLKGVFLREVFYFFKIDLCKGNIKIKYHE